MATTPVYGILLPTVAADSGIWGGENNTLHNSWDGEIARPRIPFVSPTYNVGGTTTLDLNQTTGGRVFVFTVSGASTLAFSNVPSSSFAVSVSLLITNGSAFVLTFPASVTWLSGFVPTLKTSGVDIVDMMTKDGGTTWYATLRSLRSGAAGAIYQKANLSTTSTSDVSLTSYSLPAGTLSTDGQALRITVIGAAATQAANINVKFGATTMSASNPTAGQAAKLDILLVRLGSASQRWYIAHVEGTGTLSAATGTATEALGGAVTIDFRGSVTAGGTLTVYSVMVEYLAA